METISVHYCLSATNFAQTDLRTDRQLTLRRIVHRTFSLTYSLHRNTYRMLHNFRIESLAFFGIRRAFYFCADIIDAFMCISSMSSLAIDIVRPDTHANKLSHILRKQNTWRIPLTLLSRPIASRLEVSRRPEHFLVNVGPNVL